MKKSKDPFRMPADMNDIDELKAHIRGLEDELALTEKRDDPPWWALNVRSTPDLPFVICIIAAIGSAALGGVGALHARALVSGFHVAGAYVVFWIYLLNVVVFAGGWLGYCLFSWRRTDVKPPSLPFGFSLRKSLVYYYLEKCSTGSEVGRTKTLKSALLLAHSLKGKEK